MKLTGPRKPTLDQLDAIELRLDPRPPRRPHNRKETQQ